MTYREEFIAKVKKIFEVETAAYRRKEKAYEFITEYFDELLDELFVETEAAEEELEIDFEKLRLKDRQLQIEFGKRSIEIYTTEGKNGDKMTIDMLNDDGNTYRSKKYGRPLDEDILDKYLADTFSAIIG